MSAYLSSFLNTTTSKYNNLKQTLINSDADGDIEDDSHISRVLRAYYTEKGRPFPEWLPPDPKAPPPPQPASYGMAMAAQQGQQPIATAGRFGRGGGISDLWDGPKSGQQPPQQQQPQSLRPPRFSQRSDSDQGPAQGVRPGRFGDLYGDVGSNRPQSGGRMGSFESGSRFSQNAASPAPSTGSGGTAKDMLKAKFSWGNRGTSPVPSADSGSGGYAPPGRDSSPAFGGRGGDPNPYAAANDGGGRYGGGGQVVMSDSYSGRSSGAGARGYGSSPHGGAGGGDGGSGGIKRGPQGGRLGLPSGPRPQR